MPPARVPAGDAVSGCNRASALPPRAGTALAIGFLEIRWMLAVRKGAGGELPGKGEDMRGLHLASLLLLVSGMAGCVNAACIQYGDDPSHDRCVDDTTYFWCEECNSQEDELPIGCDDYKLATSCDDEGFEYECDGIWSRVNEVCD